MVPFSAYQELVKELAAMKRDGFVPSAPLGEAPKAPELATEIEAAILALGVDPQTERQLRKTAWELKRAGIPDDEIAQKITEGEPADL
jgi:nucleotide-binding universal stress UspA family protein